MSDDINNRIDELLVLAALGELSEAENDELDGALAADSELADELAAALAIAARLQSIFEIAPPAAMKQSVMAAIRGVAQDAGPAATDAQSRTFVGELDGTLDAMWSPSSHAFILAGTGIPVLSDAETYQLWLIDAGGAVPVGLFQPNAGGEVEQVFTDVDPSDFIIGVTVEPAGGTDQPTLPVITAA
jgi:hypothetical protein